MESTCVTSTARPLFNNNTPTPLPDTLSQGTEDDLSLCFFEDQAGPLKLPPDTRLCHFPDIPM